MYTKYWIVIRQWFNQKFPIKSTFDIKAIVIKIHSKLLDSGKWIDRKQAYQDVLLSSIHHFGIKYISHPLLNTKCNGVTMERIYKPPWGWGTPFPQTVDWYLIISFLQDWKPNVWLHWELSQTQERDCHIWGCSCHR